MKWWVFITIFVTGLALYVIGNRVAARIEGHFFELEHVTHQEFADKASSLDCFNLKLYALTSYVAFLQENQQMLSMPTNDFNFALLQTHGRLYRLYSYLTNNPQADSHFVSASNAFWLLRSRPLDRSILITNAAFQVETDLTSSEAVSPRSVPSIDTDR